MKIIYAIAAVLALTACSPERTEKKTGKKAENPTQEKKVELADNFINRNNTAHQNEAFKTNGVISADIQLYFGGTERLNATLFYHPVTTQTLIKHEDGKELLYDGKEVWLCPAEASDKGARFSIFTWSYFLALPYKIDDKGTHLSDYPNKTLNGETYNVEKLTFGENIGDSPDDWYVLYQDKETNLLRAASYIVTLNSSVEKGEEDPHAIQYSDYKEVNSIPMAHRWDFFGWTAEEGLTDTLGYADLTNIHFVDASEISFTARADAKKIDL